MGGSGSPLGWGRGRPKTCQGQQRERRPRFSCQVSQTNVPAWLVPTPAHLCHHRPRVASALSASSRMWKGHLRRVGVCGRGGGGWATALAENPEPQHVLLNIITASYLHSLSLQKCLFLVGLFCLFYTIPTARGSGAVVPGDGMGSLSPASLIPPCPGDPAGCAQWALSYGLWTVVRDTLCSLCQPGSELGLSQWVFRCGTEAWCAEEGAYPGRALTDAGSLSQPRARPPGGQRVSLVQL